MKLTVNNRKGNNIPSQPIAFRKVRCEMSKLGSVFVRCPKKKATIRWDRGFWGMKTATDDRRHDYFLRTLSLLTP